MDNSLAAGRRLAARVILAQATVAVLVGMAFMARDASSAVGALAGGLVATMGTGLLALRVFAPALAGPGAMMARFAVGTFLKWIVVLAGLYLILVYWRLPALPAIIGLAAALMVNLVMLKFER